MNILLTGLNGFVGSNFTKKWKEHHVLYGLDINQTVKQGMNRGQLITNESRNTEKL